MTQEQRNELVEHWMLLAKTVFAAEDNISDEWQPKLQASKNASPRTMAAIDKLYVKDYYEYDEVRRWAIVYYPKLLLYFYSIDLRYDDFKHAQPITNTPLKVDRKLKWICPIPCVREYLHEQCGVNPKWEWLYKIFWRGKKYF